MIGGDLMERPCGLFLSDLKLMSCEHSNELSQISYDFLVFLREDFEVVDFLEETADFFEVF